MSRIIDEQGREITPDGEILEPDFQILDVYAEDGEAKPRRADWIATISAGFKNAKGLPEASHDGTIYVSGDKERCPGLIEALGRNNNKRLTIAFLSDNLNDFIFQRFTRRSASALEIYGDQYTLTQIKQERDSDGKVTKAVHIQHQAGSPEYKALRKLCKVEVSVLFALAEWDGQRTAVTFPDGLGAYRIRFTSRNSLQALVGKIEEIKARITRGRIAGVPFDLFLVNRDVPSPTGQTRNIPVWTIEFRPPDAIRLTSGNLSNLLGGALREGQRLQVMLPAPSYGIEDAMAEDADIDLELPTAEAVDVLQNGDPPCNPREMESAFFGAVKGTALASDEARRAFLLAYTNSECGSLKDFLKDARESQANALLAEVDRYVETERTAKRRAALEAEGFEAPNVIDHEPEAPTLTDAEYRELAEQVDAESDDATDAANAETAAEMVTDVADQRWIWWNQVGVACRKEGIDLPNLALPIAAADLDREIADAKAAVLKKRGVKPKQPAATT